MGYITISTAGSFPTRQAHFGAEDRGHAHAVAQAIRWLSDEVLPAAIEQDHHLAARGAEPRLGFAAPAGASSSAHAIDLSDGPSDRPRP